MTSETALSAEDITNVLEVLESQERLDHTMTLMPTDVLRRLLDAARSQPATEGLREALEQALYRLDDIGEHLRPDMTDNDKHAVAQAWWFGSEEIRAALAATEPAGDERT